MAPEVLAEGFSSAADVWGVGATLYFACCGRSAGARQLFQEALWDAEDAAALKRSIGRCLARDPASRPTAAALLEESIAMTVA
jgi:serine/threonine protein kinase